MSTLPSHVAEASHSRASTVSTYFLTRVLVAAVLTGVDGFVVSDSAIEGLRNSREMPILYWLLVMALAGVLLSLATVWYKTLRYRKSPKASSLQHGGRHDS